MFWKYTGSWENKYLWLTGLFFGLDLDHLLRFERLEADFAQLCAVLGIAPTPLPRRNASVRRHYSEYYDDELRDIVADRHRDEIEQLGYAFERS